MGRIIPVLESENIIDRLRSYKKKDQSKLTQSDKKTILYLISELKRLRPVTIKEIIRDKGEVKNAEFLERCL